MWVFARKTMFCKGATTPGLNKVSGIMIKAVDVGRGTMKRPRMNAKRRLAKQLGSKSRRACPGGDSSGSALACSVPWA
jgi:hypothetical protein